MLTVKNISIAASIVLITAIGTSGIYEWLTEKTLNPSAIFFLSLGIGFLFQAMTWGEIDGKQEGEKDEREKYITLLSSKISYFVLLIMMILILFISEGFTAMNDLENIPLVIVIGLAWITMPITEFIVSKKYRHRLNEKIE